MHFTAKCNSGRIAIQCLHIKRYLDYQYTKFQLFTFRVQHICVFARYATMVPRLSRCLQRSIGRYFFFHIFTHCVFFSHAIQFSSFILKKLLQVSKYVRMSHSLIRYFTLSITSFDSYNQ